MYKPKKLQITHYIVLAVLAAFAIALSPQTVGFAQGPTPTDDEVNRIAKQLYCPVCESTPLDVCPTEACRQWRDLIRTMLAEGKSEEEIKQYFVAQYGVRVLDEPPNRLVTYLVPGIAILIGALLLLRGFQMWMKPSGARVRSVGEEQATPAQDPYVARLEEEIKKQNNT